MTNIVLLSFQLFTNNSQFSTFTGHPDRKDEWLVTQGPRSVVAEYRIGYKLPDTNVEISVFYKHIGSMSNFVTPSTNIWTFVPETKEAR